MIKQINICNIYLFLWVIYSLHWSNCVIPLVEKISTPILGINLIISLYYTYVALKCYKLPSVFKAINLLLCVFTIYGLIYIILGPDRFLFGIPMKRGTYLISVLRSFLPIYTFFVFTKRGYLSDRTMKFWSIVFAIDFISIFFITVFLRSLISNAPDFVNNTGYLFAFLLPCVYLWRNKLIFQFIFVFFCLIFSVLSLKRGAMLCTGILFIMFLCSVFRMINSKSKTRIIIISILTIIIGYSFISERITESVLFQKRIEATLDGNVSHRDVLIQDFLNYYFNKADGLQEIFGSGADATLSVSDNFAHNDWIEILICQGIIGLLVYTYFWVSFIKQWKNTKNIASRHILGSYCIVYLIRSFVSMCYSMIFTIASLNIGYALARQNNK